MQLTIVDVTAFTNFINAFATGDTVILATTLFFAGIAPRVGWVPARMALMAVACVFLGVGIFDAAILPVSH